MTARLSLALRGTTVRATRNDVPDAFWFTLLSEWGTGGADVSRHLDTTVDRVLRRTDWLKRACEQFVVSIDWDDALSSLMRSLQQDRVRLRTILAEGPALDAAQVQERLSGTRFTRTLRPFQVRDLGKLLALDNGANFSVPGAGKTTVALATYEAERIAGRVAQMLVVAPLSAFEAWKDGINDCFDGAKPTIASVTGDTIPNAEIVLVNYHRLDNRFDALAAWARERPTLLLLDEAHRMKRGWDGAFGTACLNMAPLAARRDILTGTPAPQSPGDLTALIDFLWPGQARRILPQDALSLPAAPDAGQRVAEAIRPLFVRTKKSDLELRDPQLRVVTVDPSELQSQIYAALRDRYSGALAVSMNDRARLVRMGAVVMYLLEAATNPKLLSAGSTADDVDEFRHPPLDVPPDSTLWELIRRYNQYETPTKFEQLARIVHENAEQGRKTLVWTNFVRNIHTLKRLLSRYEPATIYGAIPPEASASESDVTREQELARFRDKDGPCKVLLANPAAMSEGVSLHHDAHDAVYLDRTFNAGQYLQSLDRIHRLGLKPDDETRITFLVTRGTVDEVIDARVKAKATLLGEMLDDPDIETMALPSNDQYGDPVDVQDLEALFRHLRGEG
ncbi:DEAD/DEAH box helicase [Microbacterium sp. BH-3-3-3]|uniref:DEAD/DEAH box helicase n=1 Tax=Microbacterium sp. BH-3-3-3 TaxID=1906742 RepID=UPI0011A5BDD7|nr:DEAD/DEAH box helicase [Microbacterium sp. BH-3-3-3]